MKDFFLNKSRLDENGKRKNIVFLLNLLYKNDNRIYYSSPVFIFCVNVQYFHKHSELMEWRV